MPVLKSSHQDSTSAVSEVIGAILLVSIVVLMVGIITMMLFSQSSPEKLPNVNFMTGSDGSGRLYLYHNGGDTLTKGTFTLWIDNKAISDADYKITGDSSEWSLGKNLIVTSGFDTTKPQHNIVLAYNATGGAISLGSGTSSLVESSSARSPDVIVTPVYPPLVAVPQLMQNVTNNSVDYYKECDTIISEGSIQFTITKINSTMFYKPLASPPPPVLLSLPNQSVVTIKLFSGTTFSPGVRIFGIGDQIWVLTAERADVTVTTTTGPIKYPDVAINHTWITGYEAMKSNLTIAPGPSTGNCYTELILNRYPSYTNYQTFSGQRINSSTSVASTIRNAGPNSIGIFILQHDNRTNSTYFVGNGTVS